MRILKYPLTDGIIEIPKVCIVKFLTIQQQNDMPTLWVLVDEESNCKVDYIVYKIGTGWNVTYGDTQNYITSLIKPALAQYKASREIQDYLVICNETNNTDYVVSNNQFIIDVLIKPTYAIDFIHLRFKNVGVNDFSIAIS